MSEREKKATEGKGGAEHGKDSEEALQKELKREASETKGIGDVGENRNLSGSSTWETLPEDN